MHRINRFLLTIMLFAALFTLGAAAEEDVVYTAEELVTWLEAHEGAGTVVLGADIALTGELVQIDNPESMLTIDTRGHGLVIEGGGLFVDNLHITGEGVTMPVLTLKSPGGFLEDDFREIFGDVSISSTGDGGTALEIDYPMDYTYPVNLWFDSDHTALRVTAEGMGGVAVHVKQSAQLFTLWAKAEGGTALLSDGNATLTLCRLEGITAAAGTAVLDTCAYTGTIPADTVIIARDAVSKNTDISGRLVMNAHYYVSIGEGTNYPDVERFLDVYAVARAPYDDLSPLWIRLHPGWDEDIGRVPDIAGDYSFPGEIDELYDGLGLFEENFPEMIVEVLEENTPYIAKYTTLLNFGRRVAMWNITVWGFPDEECTLELFRSDDEGETWYAYTEADEISIADYNLFRYSTAIEPFSLMLHAEIFKDVVSLGKTNALILSYDENNGMQTGGDGDRVGTDRDGNADPDREQAPPVIPPQITYPTTTVTQPEEAPEEEPDEEEAPDDIPPPEIEEEPELNPPTNEQPGDEVHQSEESDTEESLTSDEADGNAEDDGSLISGEADADAEASGAAVEEADASQQNPQTGAGLDFVSALSAAAILMFTRKNRR